MILVKELFSYLNSVNLNFYWNWQIKHLSTWVPFYYFNFCFFNPTVKKNQNLTKIINLKNTFPVLESGLNHSCLTCLWLQHIKNYHIQSVKHLSVDKFGCSFFFHILGLIPCSSSSVLVIVEGYVMVGLWFCWDPFYRRLWVCASSRGLGFLDPMLLPISG